MRKYKLIIGDNELTIEYSSFRVDAPQLQFNIQQFDASRTANPFIVIHNISQYYFSMLPTWINKKILLYAGMEDSPILRKIGCTVNYGLIASGYISGVVPDWNGVETVLSIIFLPTPIIDPEKQGVLMHINKGQDIRNVYLSAYNNLTNGANNLNMGKTPILSETDYDIRLFTVADLNYALTTQTNGTYHLIQNNIGFVINGLKGKTINLKPGDFVTQPSAMDSQTVAITLMMRSDIQINDIVNLPQNIYVGLNNIAPTEIQKYSSIDIFKKKNIFLLFSGDYYVNSVWQIGDSRNPDAQAWATIIQGTRKQPV